MGDRLQLTLAVAVYTATGVLSPVLIDYIAQSSSSSKKDVLALFPVMANTLGMALMQPMMDCIVTPPQRRSSDKIGPPAAGRLLLRPHATTSAAVLQVALMDLLSASMVTGGLVYVGAATYTVIYSSTVSWTALIAWYMGSQSISWHQATGIALVTLGLALNGLGHVSEDGARTDQAWFEFAWASAVVLLGTVLHAVVIIQMGQVAKKAESMTGRRNGGAEAVVRFASQMGVIEFSVLVAWNVLRRLVVVSSTGDGAPALLTGRLWPSSTASFWYAVLTASHLLHSLAFFHMIGKLGAVGTAVLKGFLALGTFGVAALMFCDGTSTNTSQCLTPIKSLSMAVVFTGGVLYANGNNSRKAAFGKPVVYV